MLYALQDLLSNPLLFKYVKLCLQQAGFELPTLHYIVADQVHDAQLQTDEPAKLVIRKVFTSTEQLHHYIEQHVDNDVTITAYIYN